jgi:hypothetical protein
MPGIGHFRAHGRRRVRLPVSLRQASQEDDGTALDLGLAGALVEIGRPLAPGSRVVMRIAAPTLWDPLLVEGVVVWMERSGARFRTGLRFQHADESALGALFELLAAQDYDADG